MLDIRIIANCQQATAALKTSLRPGQVRNALAVKLAQAARAHTNVHLVFGTCISVL